MPGTATGRENRHGLRLTGAGRGRLCFDRMNTGQKEYPFWALEYDYEVKRDKPRRKLA